MIEFEANFIRKLPGLKIHGKQVYVFSSSTSVLSFVIVFMLLFADGSASSTPCSFVIARVQQKLVCESTDSKTNTTKAINRCICEKIISC